MKPRIAGATPFGLKSMFCITSRERCSIRCIAAWKQLFIEWIANSTNMNLDAFGSKFPRVIENLHPALSRKQLTVNCSNGERQVILGTIPSGND